MAMKPFFRNTFVLVLSATTLLGQINPTREVKRLREAVDNGNEQEVARLLAAGAHHTLGKYDLTPAQLLTLLLTEPIGAGRIGIVRLLVNHGALLDGFFGGPVLTAVRNNHPDIAKYLLDKGADPNARDRTDTALMYAARQGHFELVKLLVAKGADPNWVRLPPGLTQTVKTQVAVR